MGSRQSRKSKVPDTTGCSPGTMKVNQKRIGEDSQREPNRASGTRLNFGSMIPDSLDSH
jgi:hypothetical protein